MQCRHCIAWTYPIRGRIDMLLSGIRTPLGIKLYGKDNEGLQKVARQIEETLRSLKSTQSVIADQASAGFFIDIDIDTQALKRYGISKALILDYTATAIGGVVSSAVLSLLLIPIFYEIYQKHKLGTRGSPKENK